MNFTSFTGEKRINKFGNYPAIAIEEYVKIETAELKDDQFAQVMYSLKKDNWLTNYYQKDFKPKMEGVKKVDEWNKFGGKKAAALEFDRDHAERAWDEMN